MAFNQYCKCNSNNIVKMQGVNLGTHPSKEKHSHYENIKIIIKDNR